MERRLSAGSCRPGKEQCRLAAEWSGEGKGRAGANWKRYRRSPGLAAAFPSTGRVVPVPRGEQGGALAHGGVPGPHLCPPQMSLSRSHCKTPGSCSGKDPVWERMLQKRTKLSVSKTQDLGKGTHA